MQEGSQGFRRFGLVIGLALALGCMLAPSALAAKKHSKQVKDNTVWLCKPGIPNNPCEPGFDTTLISPSGQIVGTQAVKPDKKRKFDCFYVYPTVSDDKTPNSDLSIDPEERSIALYQAARYSLHCRVFAPIYRQLTLGAILNGAPIPADAQQIAYGDVAAAWKTYLRKYNQGRGVVLIGHSQGTYVLRELIHQLDRPAQEGAQAPGLGGAARRQRDRARGRQRRRGLQEHPRLPQGEAVRLRDRILQLQCASAGRLDVRASGWPRTRPANHRRRALHEPGGARRRLGVAHLGLPDGAVCAGNDDRPRDRSRRPAHALGATTPWFQAQAYTGACDASNDAHVLQISPVAGAPTLHAVPDATWGLHLVDANIALGNLTDDVAREAKFWLQAKSKAKKKQG